LAFGRTTECKRKIGMLEKKKGGNRTRATKTTTRRGECQVGEALLE
jgi:hypothetical protein